MKNPRGEPKFHYEVVNYIKINYSVVLITPRLGVNQITNFGRHDCTNYGYCRAQPVLKLEFKDGDRIDITAIECKRSK